jgi:hypothetical protein
MAHSSALLVLPSVRRSVIVFRAQAMNSGMHTLFHGSVLKVLNRVFSGILAMQAAATPISRKEIEHCVIWLLVLIRTLLSLQASLSSNCRLTGILGESGACVVHEAAWSGWNLETTLHYDWTQHVDDSSTTLSSLPTCARTGMTCIHV